MRHNSKVLPDPSGSTVSGDAQRGDTPTMAAACGSRLSAAFLVVLLLETAVIVGRIFTYGTDCDVFRVETKRGNQPVQDTLSHLKWDKKRHIVGHWLLFRR